MTDRASIRGAVGDLARGLALWPFFGRLGVDDIRQRYVRTALGPFWMILSSAVWIFVMAVMAAGLFGQDLSKTFPFVAAGLYAWIFISIALAEGCHVFLAQQSLLTTLPLPASFFLFRYLTRVAISMLHYIPILLVILVACAVAPSWSWAGMAPALLAFLALAFWLGLVLGILSLRYRDVPHLVGTVSAALPIVSPIAWDKEFLKAHHWLADLNPVYHFVEIFRAPALGQPPPVTSWLVVVLLNIAGIAIGLCAFARHRTKLALWV